MSVQVGTGRSFKEDSLSLKLGTGRSCNENSLSVQVGSTDKIVCQFRSVLQRRYFLSIGWSGSVLQRLQVGAAKKTICQYRSVEVSRAEITGRSEDDLSVKVSPVQSR